MPWLPFISDVEFEFEVKKLLDVADAARKKADVEIDRNTIDPFSVAFEMSGFGFLDAAAWELSEKTRQAQKTFGNHLGLFHQAILGHMDGWINRGIGHSIDLECPEKRIIAEVKNKHNTVTKAKLKDVYDHLYNLVMPIASTYHGFTAYYIEIIPRPRSGYDIPFTPSDGATKTRRAENPLIRKIDGKRFYALATGVPDALDQIYKVLPAVITHLSGYSFSASAVNKFDDYYKKAFS